MLKIRMQRVGRINSPSYRVVVTEHTAAPQAGKVVELVGTYNPKSKERTLKEDRIKYWISVGAQPSATMHNMLISAGILSGKKINVLPKKTVASNATEAPAGEAAAPAVAPVAQAAAESTETPTEEPVAAE